MVFQLWSSFLNVTKTFTRKGVQSIHLQQQHFQHCGLRKDLSVCVQFPFARTGLHFLPSLLRLLFHHLPCNLLDNQFISLHIWTVKMKALCFFVTSVSIHTTTNRHNSEDHNLNNHHQINITTTAWKVEIGLFPLKSIHSTNAGYVTHYVSSLRNIESCVCIIQFPTSL
jgi:hypothetical protein